MICCEVSIRIAPEDYLVKNSQSKFIKIKEGVEIHIIHINEDLTETSDVKYTQPLVKTEQIKRVNLNENSNLQDEKKRKNNKLSENFLKLEFTNLITQCNEFKKRTENNTIHLDGIKNFGMTIIYKSSLNKPFENVTSQNKRRIFFIHGVGGNTLIWKNQLKYFAQKNYELIAVDLIGHGLSTKSKISLDYQFVEICSHIRTIFDIFASDNNVIIGHSYGCSFAVHLSQERKNLIQKVILISGGMPFPLNYPNPVLNAPLLFFKLMKPFIDCHFFSSAFSSQFKDKKKDMFDVSAESLFYTMKGQHWQPSFTSDYFKDQNVLLIEGSEDVFVPFQDAFEMMRSIDRSYLVRVERTSHMVILEQPEITNKLIELFIEDKF